MSVSMGLDYQRLMAGAVDPNDVVTRTFAGTLARCSIRGLSASALHRLLNRYFPGLTKTCAGTAKGDCSSAQIDEYDDLVALLMAHRSEDDEATQWLAYAIATACLGNNHLWQDLGLPNREALSQVLRRHFTPLYEKNVDNMKWKKFFYKQLCEQLDINVCKAPSCKVCTDYAQCFGPEEASLKPLT